MGRWILSGFTDEYADSFDQQLLAAEKFGFDSIELRHADGRNVSEMTRAQVRQIKRKLDDRGLGVSAIGSPLGKIRLDEDLGAHMELAKRLFDMANFLGTANVRIFSFYPAQGQDPLERKARTLDALERLCLLARSYGVTLCHENEANIYGDTPQRCRELLEHFDGEMKCVFDMGNFVLEQAEPYPGGYALLKDYIAYFHIKDALKAGAVVPPGKGEAKIREILDAHRRFSRKDTVLTIEPHLQTFSGLNALVGRDFENPYQYKDAPTAFENAVVKLKELISL